jgi:hypothetical protein
MNRDNIVPELTAAGASLEVVESPEFELMSAGGRADAAEGYARNPAGWCEIHVELPGPGAPTDGEAHPSPSGLSGPSPGEIVCVHWRTPSLRSRPAHRSLAHSNRVQRHLRK